VPIRHYAAASLVDLLGARDPESFIRLIDLQEARPDIAVRVEPELRALGLAAVEVDLREPGSDAVKRTVSLTDANPEIRVAGTSGQIGVDYRVRTHFDPSLTAAADRESAWQSEPGGLVVVSARRLFPPRRFTAIAGRVEFDWIDGIDLLLRVPGEPARSLTLTRDAQSGDVFFAGAAERGLTVSATWRGGQNEPTRSDPPHGVDDGILVLDSPFAESLHVVVVPMFRAGVVTIVAELQAASNGFVHARTVSWDAPDRTPVRVGLRRLPGGSQTYTYRVQAIHDDGRVEPSSWQQSSAPTLIAGADGPVAVRTADVVVLGGGPQGRGSFAIEVALESGHDSVSDVLEGTRDSTSLVLVTSSTSPAATLTVRERLNSGEVRESHWDDPPALTVIPPVPVTV
jgi:hypothetical protein